MFLPAVWVLVGLMLPVGVQPAANSPASAPVGVLRSAGRLPSTIAEASGLVRSKTAPDLYWTHNDSLNSSVLYVIDGTGRCLAEYVVGAVNLDWEALATDSRGNLYIGDIGNNEVFGMRMAARSVLRLKEPDLSGDLDRAAERPVRRFLAVDATYVYTFPAEPFDAEALFVRDGNLYLISKVRGRQTTELYQVDIREPGSAQPLRKVCELPGVRAVTDASLSDDGRRLAVCSDTYVAVFDLGADEPIVNLAGKEPVVIRHEARGIEGCAWKGPGELLLAAEGGSMYSLRVAPVGERPAHKSPGAAHPRRDRR